MMRVLQSINEQNCFFFYIVLPEFYVSMRPLFVVHVTPTYTHMRSHTHARGHFNAYPLAHITHKYVITVVDSEITEQLGNFF